MKITYAFLKGCKRFTLSNITEIEAHFKAPVQVIVGSNGSGKSSFMQELCPIPSVRTDYLPGGRKELHIEHNEKLFILLSDFSNRNSPHSFRMDGEELNVSGTTDVQTELVEQYFGITSAIRNLIYSKTTLCQTTKAERKNLFLNINPMELGLILDTHKKALGRIKDCKANLQLLYSRKTDLEGKMIPDETLHQHLQTKEKLNNELLAIDKIIYGIEQHVGTLRERFRPDLDYLQSNTTSNQQLIPSELILLTCKKLLAEVHKFRSVERGDAFNQSKEQLGVRFSSLKMQVEEIRRSSQALSEEINEYHKHLDSATERPVSAIETEMTELDIELKKFINIPENPIPEYLIDRHQRLLEDIRAILFIFRDADVRMIAPDILAKRFSTVEQMHGNLRLMENNLSQLRSSCEELEKEISQNKQTASIPDNCISSTCGLRTIFARRTTSATEKHKRLSAELILLEKEYLQQKEIFTNEVAELRPFKESHLLEYFNKLNAMLSDSYFKISGGESELIDRLQNQPIKIAVDFEEYIEGSKLFYLRGKLLEKKKALSTELSVIMKSSGASLEFLQTKLREKEAAVRISLDKLVTVEKEMADVESQYNLYLEYSLAADKIEEFNNLYSRGERALMVSKAIQYWTGLQSHFTKAKLSISEELRSLETLVRTQETLRSTYQSEIISLIGGIEKDKLLYEKVELALSPTTGIPHRSMVRYLNALINNVNYFLSQMWTYRMHILSVRDDEPLDYGFPLEIIGNSINDISQLSDGQKEVTNLAWVLTILLQLKVLNKIPFFADEIGRTFDPVHRMKILSFLGQLLDNKIIEQLFIVNHFALFTDGFSDCDVICLNPDNVPELPQTANEFVRFA